MTQLGERAEEALEALWIAMHESQEAGVPGSHIGKRETDKLLKAGLACIQGERLQLTDAGIPEARSVVRRHRLAERLLHDVLGARENLMHEKACKFEHLLDYGLDENICTLLGHPKVCPHGKAIPPGRCCFEEQSETRPLVTPLSQLEPGYAGKVAYVFAPEAGHLQKLMAMGILPGAPLRLIQRFPSFVFEAGQSQFAVDEQIADAIYVRLVEGEDAAASGGNGRGRRRLGWLWRRH